MIQSKISSSGTGFPINEESLLDAVETITKVFLEEASVDGVDDDLFQQNASRILLENFVLEYAQLLRPFFFNNRNWKTLRVYLYMKKK